MRIFSFNHQFAKTTSTFYFWTDDLLNVQDFDRHINLPFSPLSLFKKSTFPLLTILLKDSIALFHIKQRKDGKISDIVEEGEVDWRRHNLQLQNEIKFSGPVLLEINPSEDPWKNFQESWRYLTEIGWTL